MRLMFDSNYLHFLDMYRPEITFIDEYRMCEEPIAVQYFLDETGLSVDEVKNTLKFKINKNHISIPSGTLAKVIKVSKSDDTVLEVKNIQFTCYFTKDADFCMVEVDPLDSNFEKVFSSNSIPKIEDNVTLYNKNVRELIEAISDICGINNAYHAYEQLKVTPEKDALLYYDMWKRKNLVI